MDDQIMSNENTLNNCIICYENINNNYAIIDSEKETKVKYHIHCLDTWLENSKRGIMCDENIKSYSIYNNNNEFIKTIDIFDDPITYIEFDQNIENNPNYVYDREMDIYVERDNNKFQCNSILCISMTIIGIIVICFVKILCDKY